MQLSSLLDAVAAGEDQVVTRHGESVERLVPVAGEARFLDCAPVMRTGAAQIVRGLRDGED